MTTRQYPEFKASNLALWQVDGTDITLVTDADMVVSQWRRNMMSDFQEWERGQVRLLCVPWSDSFQGKTGTHVHGRGWKLHLPHQVFPRFGLWEAVAYATTADWTELTPSWAKPGRVLAI